MTIDLISEHEVVNQSTMGVIYQREVYPIQLLLERLSLLRSKIKSIIDSHLYSSGHIGSLKFHEISKPVQIAWFVIQKCMISKNPEDLRSQIEDSYRKLIAIEKKLTREKLF